MRFYIDLIFRSYRSGSVCTIMNQIVRVKADWTKQVILVTKPNTLRMNPVDFDGELHSQWHSIHPVKRPFFHA
jgi:hypothetical protein